MSKSKSFEITFNFPLEHSLHTIPLKAMVEVHHSETYYNVDGFHFDGLKSGNPSISLLPTVQVKYRKVGGKGSWVHKDSERESALSQAIGKAIEASGNMEH
jgi:hypothetical protein